MCRAGNQFADLPPRLARRAGLPAPRGKACGRRVFSRVCLFSLLVLGGATGQLRAEDDFLKLLPEKALGFAVVNRPEAVDAKLQQLGEQINRPIPSLLGMLEGPGGIQKELDKKRAIAVLILEAKEGSPIPVAPVVLAPVSDYDKFLAQFNSNETEAGITKIQLWGSASLVRKLGTYAAITGEPFREELAGLKPADEAPAAAGQWQAWIAKKDAAAVIFSPGISKASVKVQEGINMAKIMMAQAGDQGKQAVAALEMYAAFFKAAEKEVDSFGIGIVRNKNGTLGISDRARLVSGGNWASFLGDAKHDEQNVLAGLPGGPFVVAGGGPISQEGLTKLTNASFNMIKNMREMYGLSEEQAEAISELGKKKFPGIRGLSFLLGVGTGGEPILSRMMAVMRMEDSKAFLTEYEKFLGEYNKVLKKVDSPVFQPIQSTRTEVEGIQSLKVVASMPKMPNMPANSEQIMEAMYGPGGKITAWIVPCDEHTVVLSYISKEHVRDAIAAVKEDKPGLAGEPAMAKAAAMLPKASWRLYLSPKGLLDFVKRAAATALPPGVNLPIPEFGETPPVVMGVTTGADEVELQTIVPAEVVKAVGQLGGGAPARNSRGASYLRNDSSPRPGEALRSVIAVDAPRSASTRISSLPRKHGRRATTRHWLIDSDCSSLRDSLVANT